MVAVKMAYKNVVYTKVFGSEPLQLYLCTFSTINQKKPLIMVHQMSG